ncbi:MAG TPA: sigma factor-like helix-turn-helix DNA-binding protein [Vicinamibacterales bacterium]|nr:sigma factor-like helix-turn-helix DNA-binding protein [Vicinamibacterales bacterium]
MRDLLEWAIDALPAGAREVSMLRDVEGMSTADTAAALDVSEDVVKIRHSRARSSLRRELLERAGAPPPTSSASIVRAATGSSRWCWRGL